MHDTPTFTGSERRQDQRRKIADRRHDIRFEPGKEDRRQIINRRQSDCDLWVNHEK